MEHSDKQGFWLNVFLSLGIFSSILGGALIGFLFSTALNSTKVFTFETFREGENTKVLDVKGREITTFFADERRELIKITQIPYHLRDALVIREDSEFYSHQGFSLRGTLRAVFQILTGQLFSGGSTITQQLSGNIYANRRDITITRKLVELWWALLLERHYSKDEILELYLNKMPFGHGTYGVEAASQFYFRKSARDITVAESVLLAIQLVKPGLYSPIRNPNRAKIIQKEILKQMVDYGVVSKEEADRSFQNYWDNYDYLRDDRAVFFEREDKAPYFSEYIRGLLDENLLGPIDIYRNQFLIHTTLDLDLQAIADQVMKDGIRDTNQRYRENKGSRIDVIDSTFIPILDALSVTFNIPNLRVSGRREQREARSYMEQRVNPTIDLIASIFGISELKRIARINAENERRFAQLNIVEGALITLDNRTGAILAMVGGSQFNRSNQFNRAVQAKVQPGSAFKPFLYSAAIDSRRFTAATRYPDIPVAFGNDENPYTPMNYGGLWRGSVLMRRAIALSLNIPALLTLNELGFDPVINRSARMLGISDPNEIRRNFPRELPLALGISAVSPIQMARAFAVFANEGREVIPIGIRFIQDRDGNIIANPAAYQEAELQRRGADAQIMSPQTAYIMTSILQSSVEYGTLWGATNSVGGFDGMDMAGKTGTPQNWSDSWAIGYSPYMTTAVWFGFDRLGNSLGINNTGAAGPVWARFMKEAHRNLPVAKFQRPDELVQVRINANTGMLPTGEPGERTIFEWFLPGTQPTSVSPLHQAENLREQTIMRNLQERLTTDLATVDISPLPDLNLNLDLNLNPQYQGIQETRPSTTPTPNYFNPEDLLN